MTTRSVALARRIWPILIDLAGVRQTITYQDLGGRFGISGRALQNFHSILEPIERYCARHQLPPLHVLVVRKDTGQPGEGAGADDMDVDLVFAYDWRARRPLVPSEAELTAAMEARS